MRVFRPSGAPRGVLFCFPGGGYSKEYFDLQFPPHADYSMASALTARGYLVVICDHLGVGESSHPGHPELITPDDLAAADSIVVSGVRSRLEAGRIPGIPAVSPDLPHIGIGHSMGGGLLTIQQSVHHDFDAIVVMGWSAVHMPTSAQMSAADGVDPPPRARSTLATTQRHEGYSRVERGPLQHYWYHWPDVPAEIIEADDRAAVDFPPCAGRMNEPGIAAGRAASIDVPVLVVTGERDLRVPTSDEAGAYRMSPRVTYFVLPRSGHCHNLASSRQEAWRQIADWCDSYTPV